MSTLRASITELRDRLLTIEPSPWSNVEAWTASALPIFRAAAPEHLDDFKKYTAAPNWLMLARFSSRGDQWTGTPARDNFGEAAATERVENAKRAATAKVTLLAWLDGVIASTPESATPAPSELSAGRPELPANTFDVVVVCALHSPELDQLLRVGPKTWAELPHDISDPHTYHCTKFIASSGQEIRVVAAAPNQMGLTSASVLATKMILRFRPKFVAMVGIAAGAREESQGFGDIIVAEHTFDYSAGKIVSGPTGPEHVPDPKPFGMNSLLMARAKEWQRQRLELDEIVRLWPAEAPRTQLRIHVGALASGGSVVDAAAIVSNIQQHWRKLVGIEMEAYGVHCACRDSVNPEPIFMCVKSICDFAHAKHDAWQRYAAFTSAQFLFRFVTAEWSRLCSDPGGGGP